MNKMLQPYQYNRIKYLAFDLINVYHSVNDKSTQAAVYSQIYSEITSISDSPEVANFLEELKDSKLSTERAEKLVEALKLLVEPFPLASEKQIQKSFRKVKKLKIPASTVWDLRDLTYFAWNEVSSNRKYIMTADGQAFYGTMTGQTKNICAICRKTSQVTHFMAVTKTGPEGTYTKNGTYICLDSNQCNQQMQSLEGLSNFIDIIKPK